MASELAQKECVPCKGGVDPLTGDALKELAAKVEGWQVIEEHHIEKEWEFSDFLTALAFVNKVGELAEQEGHHPDFYFTWGHVRIQIFTHKIDGLNESDFILAAKIDELPR